MTDGFISNVSGTTGALRRSTYVGGSGDDGVNALVVDFNGYVVATGYTTSTDFPVKNPTQAANAGGMDAFVLRTDYTAHTTLIFRTKLGGAETIQAMLLRLTQ
jgi:hypothetical protein